MMKSLVGFPFFISLFIMTEGQPMGGYLGLPYYSSNNYYMPQLLIRPVHHPRFLPFGAELIMNTVVEENSSFKLKSKNIKQWLRLKSDHQYMLGICDHEVILVSMYKIQDTSYQIHEYPMAMPYKINCATMFTTQAVHQGPHLQHGVVLIGFESPEPSVVLYRIKNFKLMKVTKWKTEHRVQSVAHFKWHQEDRVVVIEEVGNDSVVNVHGLAFERHLPHLWLVETLPMAKIKEGPALIQFQDGKVYMAVIQNTDSTVHVYTYKNVCHGNGVSLSGNKFERLSFSSAVVAKRIAFFEAYGRKYLMTVSLHTMLYKISPEDFLLEDTKFTLSADMIVLPLLASGGGALLLGKSLDGNPHVYTLLNPGGQWQESTTPRCRRSETYANNGTSIEVDLKECIGGNRSWDGATFIEAEGYPSLLFADRTYPGELYHLPYSFRHRIDSSPPVDNLIDEIQSVWNTLRTNLVSRLLERTSEKPSEPPRICSVESEIKRMHIMLSELEQRMLLSHCSSYATELPGDEAEHNIVVDEGRPEEVISTLSEGAPEILQKAKTSGSSSSNESINRFSGPLPHPNYYQSRKPTIISPELNDWQDSDIIRDPGMDEAVGIYAN